MDNDLCPRPASDGAPLCPECGAKTAWELQDTMLLGESVFSERRQVCPSCARWHGGVVALFPWKGVELKPVDSVVGKAVMEDRDA